MDELSNSSQLTTDYNNPSPNIQIQSEICVNVTNSSENSNDQMDSSSEKVKTSTLTNYNYSCKEAGSKCHSPGILNDTGAQKLSTLEKAKNSTSCSSEIKSRHEPQSVLCPHVNCPEKIIICLDLNEEMDTTVFKSRAGFILLHPELRRCSTH
uniref:Uncharacterized protein n=1 Tax=Arion vulgaris TaxID=1028688 RepID=A0A0B7A7W9_9EUPU